MHVSHGDVIGCGQRELKGFRDYYTSIRAIYRLIGVHNLEENAIFCGKAFECAIVLFAWLRHEVADNWFIKGIQHLFGYYVGRG